LLGKEDFYGLEWGVHNVILANLKNLSDKLNKEFFLPHLYLNIKESFDKNFTVQMRKIVRKLYAKYFEILGY
tara:strand:+ start:1080 stop:1295 length:216 start_codon:yes stop_codon:yes gene_type:complete